MPLNIQNLHIAVDKKEIIRGLTLEIKPGEIHALMGPNGSGKSTLANALMGHPKYTVTQGQILLDGEDIVHTKVSDKAKKGLFLSMQSPPDIAGVTIANFLRTAAAALTGNKQNPLKFYQWLSEQMKALGIDESFASRYLNVGFSGGEKKRLEILQLLILKPKYAILDETDSGLDVDALKIVAAGVNRFASKTTGLLLITHYQRILEYVCPTDVHIMRDGRLVESGGPELARDIERHGYDRSPKSVV